FPERAVGDAFGRHGAAPDHQVVAAGVLAGMVPQRPPHPVHRQLLPVREQHLDRAPGRDRAAAAHPLRPATRRLRQLLAQRPAERPALRRKMWRVFLRDERRRLRPARGAHGRGPHLPHRLGTGPLTVLPGPMARPPRARRTDMRRAVAASRALAVAASLAAASLTITAAPTPAAGPPAPRRNPPPHT